MSWPDLSEQYIPPDGPVPTQFGEFEFTGSSAAFEIPEYSPAYGSLSLAMRGGRGEGEASLRRNETIVIWVNNPTPGTYTVVVGGDASGTSGGYNGGGNGSSASSSLYTDGGGGGGATVVYGPDGSVVACAPGTGGACGGTVFTGRTFTHPWGDETYPGVPAEFPANWSEWWPLPVGADGYARHNIRSRAGIKGWQESYSRGSFSSPYIGEFFEPDHTFSKGGENGRGGNHPNSANGGNYTDVRNSYSVVGYGLTMMSYVGQEWDPVAEIGIDFPPDVGWPDQYIYGDWYDVNGCGGSIGYPGLNSSTYTIGQGGQGADVYEGPGAGAGGGGYNGGGGGGSINWKRPVFRESILDIYDWTFVTNPDGSVWVDGSGIPRVTRRVVKVAYREHWGIGPGGDGAAYGASEYLAGGATTNVANGKALYIFNTQEDPIEQQVQGYVGAIGVR